MPGAAHDRSGMSKALQLGREHMWCGDLDLRICYLQSDQQSELDCTSSIGTISDPPSNLSLRCWAQDGLVPLPPIQSDQLNIQGLHSETVDVK